DGRLTESCAYETIGQERAYRPAGAKARRTDIGEVDRGDGLIGHVIERAGAVEENPCLLVGLGPAELAVHVFELDAGNHVVPLPVVAGETAPAVAMDRGLCAH